MRAEYEEYGGMQMGQAWPAPPALDWLIHEAALVDLPVTGGPIQRVRHLLRRRRFNRALAKFRQEQGL